MLFFLGLFIAIGALVHGAIILRPTSWHGTLPWIPRMLLVAAFALIMLWGYSSC